MPPPILTEDDPLSSAELEHIHAICDSFEAAWRSVPPRRIEDELGKLPEPLRRRLLRELVLLELELKRRGGQTSTALDYLERFPDEAEWIRAACEKTAGLTTVDQ